MRVGTTGAAGGTAAVLEVRDSGPGLDAEAKSRVFERFYRASADRGRDRWCRAGVEHRCGTRRGARRHHPHPRHPGGRRDVPSRGPPGGRGTRFERRVRNPPGLAPLELRLASLPERRDTFAEVRARHAWRCSSSNCSRSRIPGRQRRRDGRELRLDRAQRQRRQLGDGRRHVRHDGRQLGLFLPRAGSPDPTDGHPRPKADVRSGTSPWRRAPVAQPRRPRPRRRSRERRAWPG